MSDRSESGFTLVELLIATVISGVIIGGIAGIMIVTLRSYPQSAARISVSDNPQLLSSYLVPDVQSAGGGAAGIATTGLDNSVCFAPFGIPVANKLSISWTDYTTGGLFRIDYCQIGSQIVRFYRQPGVGSVQQVVSRDLVPNGFVTNLTVDSVTATVTTTDTVNGSPYAFNVTATRRTPALRISPVLTVNLATVSAVIISGTVPGAFPVSVSVTDQATPSSPAHQPLVVNPVVPGNGAWSTAPGGTDLSGLNDGIITFTASATINGHPAVATTTALKDTIPPSTSATVVSATPWTATAPVQFLVTFSEPVSTPVLVTTAQQQGLKVSVLGNPITNIPLPTATCPGNAVAGSECFSVSIPMSDLGADGPVSVQVPAGAVTDIAGNPNTASGQAATNWDRLAPTITLTARSASPTSTDGLVFRAQVSKPTTNCLTASDITAVPPGPGAPPLNIAITACPAPPSAPPQRYTITITGLQAIDNAGGPVTVTVKAGAITDTFGRPSTAAFTSPAITWSPLTIHETGPATAAVFNGVAGQGTVTVNRCADAACNTKTLIQTITVNPDGTWASQAADLTTDTYAEVVQNLNGVITTVIIPVP